MFHVPEPAVKVVVTGLIVVVLALVTVLLRLYTRWFIVRKVGADDYLIIASTAVSIAFLAVVFLQIKYGLGRQITREELSSFLMALWGTIPLYNLSLIICKLSIAVQYYRVFRNPATQRMLIAVLVILVLYGCWAVLGTTFTCWPVQKYWDLSIRDGHCLSKNAITFANAGINIASDLVLLAIPLSLLKGLQIPKRQKIILLCVFATGAFACAVSIARLRSLYEIGAAPQSEQSVQGVNIALWSSLEINVGIICASVPALKPLAVRIVPKLMLSRIYSRDRNHPQRSGPEENRKNNKAGLCDSDNSDLKYTGDAVPGTVEMSDMTATETETETETGMSSVVTRVGSQDNLVGVGRYGSRDGTAGGRAIERNLDIV